MTTLATLKALAQAATPEWRDIPGLEGYSMVSSDGDIRSMRFVNRFTDKKRNNPLMMTQRRGRGGYMSICINRKQMLVHRLVLLAFKGEPTADQESAHLNGVAHDNRADNLAWVTKNDNAAHKWKHGTQPVGERCASSVLTDEQALAILRSYDDNKPVRGKGWYAKMQEQYGVSYGCITKIVLRQAWRHLDRRAALDRE